MPMIGDNPREGWASGYYDAPPQFDDGLVEKFNTEVSALEKQGYTAYSHTSNQRKPCLYGLKLVLQELGGYESYLTKFKLGEVQVHILDDGGFIPSMDKIKLSIGDKSVSITESELSGLDGAFAQVQKYYEPQYSNLYLLHKETILRFVQEKYEFLLD